MERWVGGDTSDKRKKFRLYCRSRSFEIDVRTEAMNPDGEECGIEGLRTANVSQAYNPTRPVHFWVRRVTNLCSSFSRKINTPHARPLAFRNSRAKVKMKEAMLDSKGWLRFAKNCC